LLSGGARKVGGEAQVVVLAAERWTVNDSEGFNQLVRLGVDGITTDNLAILRGPVAG